MKREPGKKTDYYEILGVSRSANAPEIDAAYRALVRRWHPDLRTARPDSVSRMKLINEAYATLSNAQRRHEYDRRCFSSSSRPSGAPLELRVSPEEAAYGGPIEISISYWTTCGVCRGLAPAVAVCTGCGGQGRIGRRRAISLLIPPRLRSGTILRVRESDGVLPCDHEGLLLKVVVQPCW
jgi:DnaJ-class molecular chaperone